MESCLYSSFQTVRSGDRLDRDVLAWHRAGSRGRGLASKKKRNAAPTAPNLCNLHALAAGRLWLRR